MAMTPVAHYSYRNYRPPQSSVMAAQAPRGRFISSSTVPASVTGSQMVPAQYAMPQTSSPVSTAAPVDTTSSLPATSWWTDETIISGIPNWGIAAAGAVGLFLLMGGHKHRR